MNDFKTLKDMWTEAEDADSEQRQRMLDDLKFSNPTEPEQWDAAAKLARENDTGGRRPTFAFDQTNQYLAQVVNDARKNKPQIQTVPATSRAAAIGLSEAVDGIIRHIEYQSTANITYDTAVEHAARIGLGWSGLIPVTVDEAYNEQEIRIRRFHDPLAVRVDPHFVSPDGSDIDFGFVETSLSERLYKRRYGSRAFTNWDSKQISTGWGSAAGGNVRIAEAFWKEKTSTNMLLVSDLEDTRGENKRAMTEKDYWETAQKTGVKLPYHSQFKQESTKVMWAKMDGHDFLEEPTEFPCKWVPLFPTMGYELWIEGKRYLCGMVRRMRAGQQAYNLERNTELEWMAKQPRAPYLVAWQSVAKHPEWQTANTNNDAFLAYDHLDVDGNPLPPPQRLNPPQPGTAFTALGQKGIADLQAAVGMYRANLGAPSNETSGIAIRRREEQGDTANFHYLDNQSRTMTHMGRCIVDMIPKVMTTRRAVQILHLDGKSESITFDPNMESAIEKDGKKVIAINFRSGDLAVRCKVGPAYTSLREETAEALTKIVQSNPTLMSVLGPMWARMQDWPEAEHLSKLLLAIAPPPIQAIESDETDIPPAAMAQIEQAKGRIKELEQHMKALSDALEEAAKQHDQAEAKVVQQDIALAGKDVDAKASRNDALVAQYNAETSRLEKLLPFIPPQLLQAMVWQLMQSTLLDQPLDATVPMPMPPYSPPQAMQPGMGEDGMPNEMMGQPGGELLPAGGPDEEFPQGLPGGPTDALMTAPEGDETGL